MGSMGTRERMVEVADRLVHERGYNRATLADLAEKADVHPGSIYHFFRTKRALGEAVIDRRLERYAEALREWERIPDPRQRLLAFVEMAAAARQDLSEKGCPIGSLCQELHKEGSPLAKRSAELFRLFLDWMEQQFRVFGKDEAEAQDLALHVMASVQGASLLALTFKAPSLVATEAEHLRSWLKAL